MDKTNYKPVPERQVFANWRHVDLATQWRWPSFSPEEIACRGTGKLVVIASAMDKLQHLRTIVGKPLILNSAYRSPEHNKAVGGEPNSYHMAGREFQGEGVMAFDISVLNHDPYALQSAAVNAGMRGFGHYPGQNFLHVDNGPARKWNKGGWFPKAPTAEEKVPVRFEPEPEKPSVPKTILKPEVIGPVGAAIGASGAGAAVANPTNPIAWAIALAIAVAIGWFVVTQFNKARQSKVSVKGTGD